MKEFIGKPSRSIELPLGCKDLTDVPDKRNWKPVARPNWPNREVDQLEYLEGRLARLLELAGKSVLVGVSRHQDRGEILVIPDADLCMAVIFASWNGAAQERAIRTVFNEASSAQVPEPVGRWKAKRALKYRLPSHPPEAAHFIGELFRAGYGLDDLASVSLLYHEPKAG